MAQRTVIDLAGSLADAEIVQYCCRDGHLNVSVRTWQDQLCEIIFHDVLGLLDKGVGDSSALYECAVESSFYRDVMDFNYESAPSVHPYKVYQFLDAGGDVAMEILAESVSKMDKDV